MPIQNPIKVCKKCLEIKTIEEFSDDKTLKDGKRNECIICRNYSSRKDHLNSMRDPAKKHKKRKEWRNASMKQRIFNREHVVARDRVKIAVKRGKMRPVETNQCAHCYRQAENYHHANGYDRKNWFNVIPLCHKCHLKCHQRD